MVMILRGGGCGGGNEARVTEAAYTAHGSRQGGAGGAGQASGLFQPGGVSGASVGLPAAI